MRYFVSRAHEAAEAEHLPRAFGQAYAPFGPVSLAEGTRLGTPGVELHSVGGETLAIAPDTASWAFLTPAEAAWLAELSGRDFGWLARHWPEDAPLPAGRFAARLFRRGLLSLDGVGAVSGRILEDSHNTREQHLVELLVTEKCNLACGYCLAGAKPSLPHMSEEVAQRAVDLAFAMDEATDLTFEFAGGEPFLRFDLIRRLTRYIRQHPARGQRAVHLAVQTNCTLLDEERVAWMKDEGVVPGVSLDGDPESQNWSRPQVNGKGSFAQVMRGLDLLQSAGVPFGVLVVLNRSNIAHPERLLDFLVENGIDSVKINPIAYLGTGRESWHDLGLTQDEVVDYFTRFAESLVGRRRLVREANLAVLCTYLVSKTRGTRCMRNHCGAGRTFQAVSPTGDIFPCGRATQSPGMKLGNVREESVSLSAPSRRSLRILEIENRRPKDLEGCDSCAYRQLCQSGCHVQSFERYGTVRHRTPECHFFKTMYPQLMRWLSFDAAAFGHLAACGYFDGPAEQVVEDYLRPSERARGAA